MKLRRNEARARIPKSSRRCRSRVIADDDRSKSYNEKAKRRAATIDLPWSRVVGRANHFAPTTWVQITQKLVLVPLSLVHDAHISGDENVYTFRRSHSRLENATRRISWRRLLLAKIRPTFNRGAMQYACRFGLVRGERRRRPESLLAKVCRW